ncbi:MAG: lysophospholipid acyltransferase family protein [Deltaproteobacteria bacterium]
MVSPRALWYDFVRGTAALVFRGAYGMKIRVYGRENVPRKGGFILASNHASHLDPEVLAIACPRQVSFMAKEELFRNVIFGSLIHSVGAFPVKRGSADMGAIRTAFKRVRKGGGLLLFPQGGRRPIDDAGEPEPGVGMFSQRMEVPVVPAFVEGTHVAMAPGTRGIVKGVTVTVRFGPALRAGTGTDYAGTASRIMKAIRSLRG